MKDIKWIFLMVLVLSSVGCASVNPSLFQSTLADNPNISPDQLRNQLGMKPYIDQTTNNVRMQAYSVGGKPTAVYFEGGQLVATLPSFDEYSNLQMLLKLGAINQSEYNTQYNKFKADDAAAAQLQNDRFIANMQGKCEDMFCSNVLN